MLHDLAKDEGYVSFKREQNTEKDADTDKGCQKPALQLKTAKVKCLPTSVV